MKEQEGILVSDVCGTLFYENTTLGFIKFHLKEYSKFKFLIFLIITNDVSPILWVFKLMERVFSNKDSLFKKLIILFLKGEDEIDIKNSAKLYTNLIFRTKKIKNVWNFLKKYKNENYRIILASSSIEPVVKEIAKKIKAEYFSSTLEIKNLKYTGNILDNIHDNKIKYLKLLGIEYKKIDFFFSDNFEDLKLIKNAQKGVAIVHSFKRSIFWKKNKIKNLLWV